MTRLPGEAALQRRVCELLTRHGWYVLEADRATLKSGYRQRKGAFEPGFPDLLCLKGDRHLLIELKTPSGKVRPGQTTLHARLKTFGIQVVVCRTEEDVLVVLRGRT